MTKLLRIARAIVPLASALVLGCIVDEPARPHLEVASTPIIRPPPPPEEACVYLRGEFSTPGRYVFVGPAHVVEAIDAAGGLTPIADSRVILSRRLIDGRLERRVIATDAVRAGLMVDPEVEAEDVIDAIGLH